MEIKYVKNPHLNKKVSRIMDDIIGEIVNKYNPKSVIVMGSFGRGEGLVVEDSNNNILFYSDCEMLIYPFYNVFKYDDIQQFKAQISRKYGLNVDIGGFNFSLLYDLNSMMGLKSVKLKPTIENFDLKYGSSVVYGKDILSNIQHIDFRNISLWEGFRLVFNRMAELLELYEEGIRKTQLSLECQQKLYYRINKLILAVQDLLLIQKKYYWTSYEQRNIVFRDIFLREYEELYMNVPDFINLTIKATDAKLNAMYVNDDGLFVLWDKVLIYVDEILRYVLLKELNISYNTYFEFRESFLSNPYVKIGYYRGLSPRPIYQNSKCVLINTLLLRTNLGIKWSNSKKPWFHLVYSAIPVLYFSTHGGVIQGRNAPFFNDYGNVGCLLEGLPIPSDTIKIGNKREWDNTKRKIIELWKCICYSCGQ